MAPHSSGTTLRCFIALDLPPSAQNQLTAVQQQLKSTAEQARWTPPQNFHMTLRFFKDRSPECVTRISNALIDIFHDQTAFVITLDTLDAFPDSTQPRVIWAGLSDTNNPAFSVVRRLNNGLAGLGLAQDSDEFIRFFPI